MDIKELIAKVIDNKDNLTYLNIDEENRYTGWVRDFNIKLKDGSDMSLDLKKEEDLFLLFVLASSWSKTGAWENAAFFAIYLKLFNKAKIDLWLDDEFIENELLNREKNARDIIEVCSNFSARKKVSFRKDYYSSVKVLAENWNDIKSSLEESSNKNDFNIFIDYIRNVSGLGSGKNKMKIKILLILRELRCQNIYSNINGELCCIPDNRVKINAEKLGIMLPNITSMNSVLKASKIIYKHFGDLYDIPLP